MYVLFSDIKKIDFWYPNTNQFFLHKKCSEIKKLNFDIKNVFEVNILISWYDISNATLILDIKN